jgi:hypothetical protein
MFKRAICQDDLPPYRVRYVLFLYDEHGFEMELNDDAHDLTDHVNGGNSLMSFCQRQVVEKSHNKKTCDFFYLSCVTNNTSPNSWTSSS